MKIHSFIMRLALLISIIFGGTFTIRYIKTGELLLDQMLGGILGIVLIIVTIVFGKMKKTPY